MSGFVQRSEWLTNTLFSNHGLAPRLQGHSRAHSHFAGATGTAHRGLLGNGKPLAAFCVVLGAAPLGGGRGSPGGHLGRLAWRVRSLLRHNRVKGAEFHRVGFASCRVSSSVRPRRPSSPVHRAADVAPSAASSLRSFPSRSRSLPRGRNGCTRSSSTAIAWPRASTTAACNF